MKKINVKIISHNIICYYVKKENVYNTFIDSFEKVVQMLQKINIFTCKKIIAV